MEKSVFNPFSNRLSRDIRNQLSEALVHALETMNPAPFEETAQKFLDQGLDSAHQQYVQDRRSRYRVVLSELQRDVRPDALSQAFLLWDNGLFFEVHEHLEFLWREASGERREALKGFIKAAGVYVHREQEHWSSAQRLASKAAALLRRHGASLLPPQTLNKLVTALEQESPVAPKLQELE